MRQNSNSYTINQSISRRRRIKKCQHLTKAAGKSHQLNTSGGDKHRSRSRSPLTNQRGSGKDPAKDSLMQSNFLATEAAITALAEQHLKMFGRQGMPAPTNNNKGSPMMPMMSPFLPGMPPLGSHYPLNLPPLGASSTQVPPLILPPPPPPQQQAAYSPMLSPKSLQNKFMQSMSQVPANVSESDFFRMLAAMPNMNGQPGMLPPPPLSRSPSINKTTPLPQQQPPNPADIFNNNFFLQHFFENLNATNRTASAAAAAASLYADESIRLSSRPVDEEKSVSSKKDFKQLNEDELAYERKAKKPKFSYSAESLIGEEMPSKKSDEIIKPLDEKNDENIKLVEEVAPVEPQTATTDEPEQEEAASPGGDASSLTDTRDEETVDKVNGICNDNAVSEQPNDQDILVKDESCCDLSQTTGEKVEEPPEEDEKEAEKEEVTTS